MIIKIKTFSGETLYIPEEDYLDEVMYSNLVNKASKNKKIREIGQKFLDVRKPTGGMEAWAKEHGVRPNLNSVGRRVNRGFDQPMTRLEKYKLDKMYSDLEEREFTKNSIRYTKKLMKSAINEGLRSAEKTGTPQLSNATQQRLLRVNGGKAKNLMSMPKQMTISSKGINKNSIRRMGQDPRAVKEAMPGVAEGMRQQAKYTTDFINSAPDRNRAIAQVRSNARDAIKNGFFG